MSGTYQDFLFAIGTSESSNRDGFVNRDGYAGYFQFGETAMRMIGWYQVDATPGVIDFKGGWTAEAKANGVNSLQDFLSSHAIQEKAITEYYQYLWMNDWGQSFENTTLKDYIGKTVGGIKISVSGLIAGSHLVGADQVEAWLKSGGVTTPNDPYGTKVSEYVSKFANYDMSPVTKWVEPGISPTPTPTPTPSPVPGTIKGTSSSDTLNGTSAAESIFGNDGNDVINGKGGNDILTGGAGRDVFVFDTSPKSNVDKITDFTPGADKIHVENAVFAGGNVSWGTLPSSKFTIGAKAADSSDRFIYNKDTGSLYFDKDGTGSAAQVEFAKLATNLKMTAADFYIL
jgi:serralysin